METFTKDQLAEIFHVHEQTVKKWIYSGEIKAGGFYGIKKESIDDFVSRHPSYLNRWKLRFPTCNLTQQHTFIRRDVNYDSDLLSITVSKKSSLSKLINFLEQNKKHIYKSSIRYNDDESNTLIVNTNPCAHRELFFKLKKIKEEDEI